MKKDKLKFEKTKVSGLDADVQKKLKIADQLMNDEDKIETVDAYKEAEKAIDLIDCIRLGKDTISMTVTAELEKETEGYLKEGEKIEIPTAKGIILDYLGYYWAIDMREMYSIFNYQHAITLKEMADKKSNCEVFLYFLEHQSMDDIDNILSLIQAQKQEEKEGKLGSLKIAAKKYIAEKEFNEVLLSIIYAYFPKLILSLLNLSGVFPSNEEEKKT